MPKSIAAAASACQTAVVDPPVAVRATTVDLLALINRALSKTPWTQEALAAHMGHGQAYVSYISRVLSGEKPLSAAFVLALPEDVQTTVAKLYAESFGLIVVEPSSGDDAVRQLVSGLCGLLVTKTLPTRAQRMAKVSP